MNYHNDRAVIVRAEPLPPDMASMHQRIDAIEAALERGETLDLPLRHYFSHKVYAREMLIPAGCVVTGKIHKYESLNILLSGELSVLMADGVKRVKAPLVLVAPAGTRRVAFAHEDSVWLTVHGTEERDLDKIEEQFIAQTHADYLAFVAALEHEQEVDHELG